MAKFNVVQKQRRAAKAQIKRDAHGDPLTKKLKIKQQPTYVSNKRKRKLMKKKRRVRFSFLLSLVSTLYFQFKVSMLRIDCSFFFFFRLFSGREGSFTDGSDEHGRC